MKIHLFSLICRRENKVHKPQQNTGRIQSSVRNPACSFMCLCAWTYVQMISRGSAAHITLYMHRQVSQWTSLIHTPLTRTPPCLTNCAVPQHLQYGLLSFFERFSCTFSLFIPIWKPFIDWIAACDDTGLS